MLTLTSTLRFTLCCLTPSQPQLSRSDLPLIQQWGARNSVATPGLQQWSSLSGTILPALEPWSTEWVTEHKGPDMSFVILRIMKRRCSRASYKIKKKHQSCRHHRETDLTTPAQLTLVLTLRSSFESLAWKGWHLPPQQLGKKMYLLFSTLLTSQSTYKKKKKKKEKTHHERSTLIFNSQPPHDLHSIQP